MLKIVFDGLLTIFIILSFVFVLTGNIARLVFWLKYRRTERYTGMHYCRDFWYNEWGTECTKEEITNLKHMVKQFEEQHNPNRPKPPQTNQAANFKK